MIYLAADHRGFELKEGLKKYLVEQGHEVYPVRGPALEVPADAEGRLTSNGVEDVGAFTYDKDDDYVDFAKVASEKIAVNLSEHRGIFICGSGHGMDVVASKFKGLLAAKCSDIECAIQAREHGNSNVLTLGADYLTLEQLKEIVDTWLKTPFTGEERHVRRLNKIKEIEERNFR